MKKILFVGLDGHKESIVVATAPQSDVDVPLYGQISGTLEALDKFIKKRAQPEVDLHFVYEAVRDLVRARDRVLTDQGVKNFLLLLGHRYQGQGN